MKVSDLSKWGADGAMLEDGESTERNTLGWEEADFSAGPIEFEVTLGHPQRGALPHLIYWQWSQKAAPQQREEDL